MAADIAVTAGTDMVAAGANGTAGITAIEGTPDSLCPAGKQ